MVPLLKVVLVAVAVTSTPLIKTLLAASEPVLKLNAT